MDMTQLCASCEAKETNRCRGCNKTRQDSHFTCIACNKIDKSTVMRCKKKTKKCARCALLEKEQTEDPVFRCTNCGEDLGKDGRQLCKKYYCPNEKRGF